MPSFRVGTVDSVLEARPGLQRVLVALGEAAEPERAYVLTMLTGEVATGDRVIVNTTAVDLGLGTGGWHVVHWNLERTEWHEPGPGPRAQAPVHELSGRRRQRRGARHGAHRRRLDRRDARRRRRAAQPASRDRRSRSKHARPDARIAYVMTDARRAAHRRLRSRRRAPRPRASSTSRSRAATRSAVTTKRSRVYSALAVARHLAGADVAIVVMGPGIVGTGTRLGFSGIELGPILDAAAGLGGVPIACVARLVRRRTRASHAVCRTTR